MFKKKGGFVILTNISCFISTVLFEFLHFILIVEMQGFIQMSHFLEAVVSKNSKLANENVQNN